MKTFNRIKAEAEKIAPVGTVITLDDGQPWTVIGYSRPVEWDGTVDVQLRGEPDPTLGSRRTAWNATPEQIASRLV